MIPYYKQVFFSFFLGPVTFFAYILTCVRKNSAKRLGAMGLNGYFWRKF